MFIPKTNWELRVFWKLWRLSFDRPEYESGGGIYVLYFGPFVVAKHWLPKEQ